MKSQYLFGIDLGGTKIEGVIIDQSNQHEVIFRDRVQTEQLKGYTHILNQIHSLLNLMIKKVDHTPLFVGMGTPGTLDPKDGTIKNSNTLCLNGKPLNTDLIKRTGVTFLLANDANCFALAEFRMGSVAKYFPKAKNMFGVIMGTGVGGGLIINKQLVGGAQGIGGEWGHSFLDESGGKCYCGNIGCVEKVIAGPALEQYYYSLTKQKKSLKEIYQSYQEKSDESAVQTIERLINFFGKGIANLINIIDPEIIVIGGGVGNIPELYTKGIQKIEQYVFNRRLDTKIIKPTLGDSAGVFGAAFIGAAFIGVDQ